MSDRQPKFGAFMASCMLLLPILLLLRLVGTVPYRFYRKRFARPPIVNMMIGMTAFGVFGFLSLVRAILAPKSRFDLLMTAPPIILTAWLLAASAAVYGYFGSLPAYAVICVTVLIWIAWISYRDGFQTLVGRELETMSLDDQQAKFESLFYRLPPRALVGTIIAICLSGIWGGIFFALATTVSAFAAYWASIVAYVHGGLRALVVLGPLVGDKYDSLALAE